QFSLTCSSRISHFVCAFFEIRNQTVKDQPLSPSVHCKAQPPTISHQISTVRKELSSNELGRTPSHRPDRLQADHQHTVPACPVKPDFACFRRGRSLPYLLPAVSKQRSLFGWKVAIPGCLRETCS